MTITRKELALLFTSSKSCKSMKGITNTNMNSLLKTLDFSESQSPSAVTNSSKSSFQTLLTITSKKENKNSYICSNLQGNLMTEREVTIKTKM